MNVRKWLLEGDEVIQRLTKKYLDGESIAYTDSGYIGDYLDLFDQETHMWGGGVYGPKWQSTHYTMKELKEMELDPSNASYQSALGVLLANEWQADNSISKDLCVSAMLLSLLSYGQSKDKKLLEIIDLILATQLEDGGWNCNWNYQRALSTRGSFHTSLSVLEAIRDFRSINSYREGDLKLAIKKAHRYFLDRQLLYRKTNGVLIHKAFTIAHYPVRWKYDYLRCLLYFESINHPYDPGMEEGLNILIKTLQKQGKMNKGPTYSGRLHFKLRPDDGSRFNTLRSLRVLKKYKPDFYKEIYK